VSRSIRAAVGVAALVALGAGCSLWSHEPERSVAAFCRQAPGIADLDGALASGDPARTSQEVTALHALQDASPPDIATQVGTLTEVVDELSHSVATAKDPDVAAADVFSRHQSEVDAIGASATAVQQYAATNCHLTLGDTQPPATAPPSSTTTTTTRRSQAGGAGGAGTPTTASGTGGHGAVSSTTTRRAPTTTAHTTTTR
jgi:hypothetical protein